MVQVAGQGQGLGLQIAIRLQPIHQLAGIQQQLLGIEASELIGPLKLPESVGHFGEHQLRRQYKGGRTNRLRQPRGGCITQGQPHGR
jgi:hypothetical protein